MAEQEVVLATEADLQSLSTIVPRAFHKNNDFFRTTFPDTPLIRQWWSELFLDAINDRTYHVMISKSDGGEVSGLLLLHQGSNPDVFKRHEPTPDHDAERFEAILDVVDSKPSDKPYFSIELVGVDGQCQGSGIGKRLLQAACRKAESEGLDVALTANMKASAFYEKAGFIRTKVIEVPGTNGYGQASLEYRVKKQ